MAARVCLRKAVGAWFSVSGRHQQVELCATCVDALLDHLLERAQEAKVAVAMAERWASPDASLACVADADLAMRD
eukprot:9355357-Alexandrium_andersonii.AAC.1